MSDTAEKIISMMAIDRARKRWRFIAVVAVLILIYTFNLDFFKSAHTAQSDYIAQVSVDGIITGDADRLDVLKTVAGDDKAKALLLRVDSPGGTMVGGLNLYHAIRAVSAKKPVVVVMDNVAASAGYLISIAGDHIIANEATMTGSIGVMMPLVDATELANKIGVRSDIVASGKMKAVTLPIEKRDDAARGYLQGVVNELQDIFLKYVKDRRNVAEDTLRQIGDGRMIIGTQALALGLVDGLGTAEDARVWLEKNHEIGHNTPVKEMDPMKPEDWFSHLMSGQGFLPQIPGLTAYYGAWAIQR